MIDESSEMLDRLTGFADRLESGQDIPGIDSHPVLIPPAVTMTFESKMVRRGDALWPFIRMFRDVFFWARQDRRLRPKSTPSQRRRVAKRWLERRKTG